MEARSRAGSRATSLLVFVSVSLSAATPGCGSPAAPASVIGDEVSRATLYGCTIAARCGSIAPSEIDACTAAVAAQVRRTHAYSLDEAIAAGRLTVDHAAAGRCISALQAASCSAVDRVARTGDCAAIYLGQVKSGGPCKGPSECESGYCAGLIEGCSGACTDYTATGGACNIPGTRCAPTDYCDPGGGNTCKSLPGAGENCTSIQNCAAGLNCIYSSGTYICQPPGGLGDSCAYLYTAAACVDGYYCDTTSFTCQLQVPTGGPCNANLACLDGGVCQCTSQWPGKCVARLELDAECRPDGQFQCGSYACADDASCDYQNGVCVPQSGFEGASCGPATAACNEHYIGVLLYCDNGADPQKGTCAVEPGIGMPCVAADATHTDNCQEGSCDSSTHICVVHCI